MRHRFLLFCTVSMTAVFLLGGPTEAADEKVPLQLKQPLKLDEMKDYEEIAFERDNFAKIENGMTEGEVLQVLGKPLDLKKEHRPSNKWTVHYLYPGGCEVNFKNGLVVGKACH